jgi:hypothetical protein
VKLWEFLPELMKVLEERLRSDDKRWGDTWLKRTRAGQDERFIASTNDRIDKYINAGAEIDYLAIIGDAFINWVRRTHSEHWPK